MNLKKARLGFPHLISAVLILVLIIVVLFIFSPMFEDLKDKLGFGIDLTAGEMKAQTEAISLFTNTLTPLIKDCMNYEKNKCFCTNQEISFPNEYCLNFLEEGGFKLQLHNHLGGLVLEENFGDIVPLAIPSDSIARRLKDSGFKIIYSSDSKLIFVDFPTLKMESIDTSHTFFKWNESLFAVLSDSYSKQWHVLEPNLCSD